MRIGVHRKEESRGVLLHISQKVLQPARNDWEGNVQVNTRDKDVLGAAVEEDGRKFQLHRCEIWLPACV